MNNVEERLAALDEMVEFWKDRHVPGKPGVKEGYRAEQLSEYIAERAKLRVRKARLEKDLNIENKTIREV